MSQHARFSTMKCAGIVNLCLAAGAVVHSLCRSLAVSSRSSDVGQLLPGNQ